MNTVNMNMRNKISNSHISYTQNTWGVTKYTNHSFKQLSSWILKNPYKNFELKEAVITKVINSKQNEIYNKHELAEHINTESEDKIANPENRYEHIVLIKEQSTYKWLLLSAWISSEEFRCGLNTKKYLHQMITDFQLEILNGFLTGTKLQRKKKFIYDSIGELSNISPPIITDKKDEGYVIETICRLTKQENNENRGVQWILCDQSTGAIEFYPTGISTWSTKTPVYIADKNGTWIMLKKITNENLVDWIRNELYNNDLPPVSNNGSWKIMGWSNDEFINTKTKQELMKELSMDKTKNTKDELIIQLTKKLFFNIYK